MLSNNLKLQNQFIVHMNFKNETEYKPHAHTFHIFLYGNLNNLPNNWLTSEGLSSGFEAYRRT